MFENTVMVGSEAVSASEVEKALALLRKTKEQRAKQSAKNKDNPEVIEKRKAYSLRQRVKTQLFIKKATAAGITVTDKEIDDALAASDISEMPE